MTGPDPTPATGGCGCAGGSAAMERIRLSNGASVVCCAAPPSRLGALAVAVPLAAGYAPAACLLAALWRRCARDEVRLARLGARFEPLVTPDCVGLRIEAPAFRLASADAAPFPPAIDVPDPDELGRVRRSCATAAMGRTRALDVLRKVLFGPGHPYGISERDRGEAALSCTDDEVRSWVEQVNRTAPVVAVCGMPAGVVDRLCERLDRRVFEADRHLPPVEPPRVSKATVRHRAHLPGRRARYLLGTLGAALGAPEKFAVHVAWAVLAGRDGLLDQRLRRERALTYSLAAFTREFARGGYCACTLDCDPAAVDDVGGLVAATLADLAAGRVTGADLDRARQRLTVQYHLASQSCRDVATRACCYAVSGVATENVAEYPIRMLAVTAADVRRAAELLTRSTRVEIVLLPDATKSAVLDKATTTVFQDVLWSADF